MLIRDGNSASWKIACVRAPGQKGVLPLAGGGVWIQKGSCVCVRECVSVCTVCMHTHHALGKWFIDVEQHIANVNCVCMQCDNCDGGGAVACAERINERHVERCAGSSQTHAPTLTNTRTPLIWRESAKLGVRVCSSSGCEGVGGVLKEFLCSCQNDQRT